MDNPVRYGYRHVIIKEELTPVGEILVGADDKGAILIHGIYKLKQVIHSLFVHGRISHIQDQHVKLQKASCLFLELAFQLDYLKDFYQGGSGNKKL